ncbi:hypothetical protein N9W34_06895, partial [Rickettsiales bacterium]|nr:hypothetical protein [Rickettsiales bacterium]
MSRLSVIVPIASWDKSWLSLVSDLVKLPDDVEIVFVACDKDNILRDSPPKIKELKGKSLRWVKSSSGYIRRVNAGIDAAVGDYLWILPPSSRFSNDTVSSLYDTLSVHPLPSMIYHWKIRFLNDSPALIFFIQWWEIIKSRLFKIPSCEFGICISREFIEEIGGIPEGKDSKEGWVLFAKNAKLYGASFLCTGGYLLSKGSKYRKNGIFRMWWS